MFLHLLKEEKGKREKENMITLGKNVVQLVFYE